MKYIKYYISIAFLLFCITSCSYVQICAEDSAGINESDVEEKTSTGTGKLENIAGEDFLSYLKYFDITYDKAGFNYMQSSQATYDYYPVKEKVEILGDACSIALIYPMYPSPEDYLSGIRIGYPVSYMDLDELVDTLEKSLDIEVIKKDDTDYKKDYIINIPDSAYFFEIYKSRYDREAKIYLHLTEETSDSSKTGSEISANDTEANNEPKEEKEENTQYCLANGCTQKGTHSITGISGETEWYCDKHYQEMLDIIKIMEDDVAASAYSSSGKTTTDSSVASYDATLDYGGDSVLVCSSEEAMDRYINALINGNQGTVNEMLLDGQIKYVSNGTKCNIVKKGLSKCKVKILEGEYSESTVWVLIEAVNEK